MPTGQLCSSQCHELGHNKLSPKCSVNIADKQSEALAAITAAQSNSLNSMDPRNNYNYAQHFNPSPANKGEFNSIADTNLLNDSICHPTATHWPKSLSTNHSPRSANSNHIEATPADDEFRRDVQDLSDYRGIGAVAWGKHISGSRGRQDMGKISVSQRQDLSGKISVDQLPVSAPSRTVISRKVSLGPTPCRIRLQISEPLPQSDSNISPTSRQEASYIEASAEDEVIMSEEANSRCLVLFADSVIPVVLPVPRSLEEFEQGGARAGSKRNRRNAEIVDLGQHHIGSTDVQG